MNLLEVKGIIAAMVTPLVDGQKVNKKATQELVNFLINKGVSGILCIGGAGEFSTLTFEEKKAVLEVVIQENNGRVPVYAGTASITTAETISLTKMAENIGADAITLLAPYSIGASQAELYNHFKTIAANTRLPIMLYNHPKRTGVNLSLELVAKLAKIDNIIGIKDSSGDFTLTIDYLGLKSDKFAILEGIDTLILAGLVYGAAGSVSSTAGAVPELVVKIYNYFIQGDLQSAAEAQATLTPFRKAFSMGTFPAVLKETLNMIGIDAGKPRLPVEELSRENCLELRKILKNII
jgi:4-hydroxy-tetrahydrodipicolinate synthase